MIPTTPRQPVHTIVLPAALVALDIEVRADFLQSDDLETICAVAGKAGAAVLIASAGQPREQRENAFAIWRKAGLEKLAVACPGIIDFLGGNAELLEAYETATIDLLKLDRLMHDGIEAKEQQRRDRLTHGKQTLMDVLSKNTPDLIEGRFPRYCVIRGDGEMKLFHSRENAVEWCRCVDASFHLIPLDREKRKFHLPE